MKTKSAIFLLAVLVGVSQLCLAGSIKGKVTPGKGAVVYAEGTPAPVDKTAVMDQHGLLFQPHILVVQVGTTVEFLNSDKVQHNVFWPHISGDKKKSHNMGTWPQGQKRPFKFTEPGIVTLLCNVHPEMAGFIIVTPNQYSAQAGDDGSFTINGIPDGQYTITAWHEGKKVQSKQITVSGAATADFTLQ